MNDSEWKAFWDDLINYLDNGELKTWLKHMKSVWEIHGDFKPHHSKTYKIPLRKRIKCIFGLHDWLYYHKECVKGECRWCGKPIDRTFELEAKSYRSLHWNL